MGASVPRVGAAASSRPRRRAWRFFRARFRARPRPPALAVGGERPLELEQPALALGSNPLPIVIPCHRVLRSGGALGGYGGGPERKRWLLELEGALPSHR